MIYKFVYNKSDFYLKTEKNITFESAIEKAIEENVIPIIFEENKEGTIEIHYDVEFKVIEYKFFNFPQTKQMLFAMEKVSQMFREPHRF